MVGNGFKQYISADGSHINIPDNVTIEQPIVIHYSANSSKKHIYIGKNSKVQIIDLYPDQPIITKNSLASSSLRGALSDGAIQYHSKVHLADNAYLSHTIIQHTTKNSQHLEIKVLQKTNSQLNTQILCFGGNTNHMSFHASLTGANTICNIHALEYTKHYDTQALDIQIDHTHGHNTSNTLIRSIVDNNSTCSMNGKILVAKNASQVKAELQHKTILLSEHAKIESLPQLEIYNDDVMCSHGSSIGTLDRNALFYMNSRGIAAIEARLLLLQSFIAPIINAISHVATQQYVQQLMLPGKHLCNI